MLNKTYGVFSESIQYSDRKEGKPHAIAKSNIAGQVDIMSWDILIQDTPQNVQTVADIPNDFQPKPLGHRKVIIARIQEVLPDADFSDPTWGKLDQPGFSIEFNMGQEDICSSFSLQVRGGGDAVSTIARLLQHLGNRAIDCQAGDFFSAEAAQASFDGWQKYRDHLTNQPKEDPSACNEPSLMPPEEIGRVLELEVEQFFSGSLGNEAWNELRKKLLIWIKTIPKKDVFAGLTWAIEHYDSYQIQWLAGDLLLKAQIPSNLPVNEWLERVSTKLNLSSDTVVEYGKMMFGQKVLVEALNSALQRDNTSESRKVRFKTMLYFLGQQT